MPLTLRPTTPADYPAITALLQASFADDPHSDQTEHLLVGRLRQSAAYIPELDIVAEQGGQIVGHILLSKIKIRNGEQTFDSLALAPVAVLPAQQGQGIGGQLIEAAHRVARLLGHRSVVLLGHAGYYPRFGYERASRFGIALPFEVPDENCMAVELVESGLAGVSGMVEYPAAFFG